MPVRSGGQDHRTAGSGGALTMSAQPNPATAVVIDKPFLLDTFKRRAKYSCIALPVLLKNKAG